MAKHTAKFDFFGDEYSVQSDPEIQGPALDWLDEHAPAVRSTAQ